jgi:integrase
MLATHTRRFLGIEPKILSDRVGHSNPTVTFQIYAHRSTGRDRAAAELIGRLIEEAISGSEDTAPEAC